MAKKLNAEDFLDVKGLTDQLAQVISQSFKKGTREAFIGKNFIDELNDQLKDFTKQQQARAVSEQVVQRAIRESISERQAELAVVSELAVEQNRAAIAELEAKKKAIQAQIQNRNLTDETIKQLIISARVYKENIESLAIENAEIKKLTAERKKQIDQEEQFDKARKAQEHYRENLKEITKEAKELTGSLGKFLDTVKSIATDGTVGALIFFTKMNQAREAVVEGYREIREEGFSITQALGKTTQNVGVYFSTWGVGFKEAMEAQKGLVEALGSTSDVTAEVVGNAAQLGKTYGISEEAAGKLTGQLMNMPGATAETANNTLEFAGNLAKAAKVAPGAVMSSIANSAEEVALYSKDGGKNIATTAVAAKKLGVEFSTLAKATESLLDFENSINKQMEASVLLGREINLDRARELALSGDLVGATQEMLQNIGGEAEFNRMNVLQRKALADSMGVSVQELSKMVKNQDKLASLTEEQREALANGDASLDEILSKTGGFVGKLKDGLLTAGGLFGSFKMIKDGLTGAVGVGKQFADSLKEGKGFMGSIVDGIKNFVGLAPKGTMSKAAEAESKIPKDAGKTTGGLTGAVEKIDAKKLLAGSAALVLTAGAVFVFAKAAQEFANVSWESIGKAVVGMIALVGALALIGAVMMSGVGAGAILAGAAAMLVMASALFVMGKAIQEMATGFNSFLPALQQLAPMANQIADLGLSFAAVGAGMVALGAASMVAFPGLMLTSLALGVMLPSLMLIAQIGQMGGLSIVSEGLMQLSTVAPGLGLVAMSLMSISAGLGAVALSGLAALPVIGALTALATVAPALSALAESFGGIGGEQGGEQDDKMDLLISEIRELKQIASKGGVINLDGRKVGDVLRLSVNSSNIR